jgi:dCMP deaminase
MRPLLSEYLMTIAHLVSERSTCLAGKVGAVATRDGRILMTSYNGVPSGVPHCNEGGCIRLEDNKHAFLLHAEENLVAQGCKYGISLNGSTVYCTHLPCSHCMAMLVQAGVVSIIYAYDKLTDRERICSFGLAAKCKVTIFSIDGG